MIATPHHGGTYVIEEFYVPPRMMNELTAYIEHGVPPCNFLGAVLANSLRDACQGADEENLRNLPAFVSYLYNHAPGECWGSPEKVGAWLDQHRQRREGNNSEGEP